MSERKAAHTDLKILAQTFGVLASEVETTLTSLKVCEFKPFEIILKEGEAGSEVFVLLKGRLSVSKRRLIFFSKQAAQLKPGDLFGEIGFLVPTTRSATITAAEPAEVARITLEDFRKLLSAHPQLQARIEEMARRRLYSLSSV